MTISKNLVPPISYISQRVQLKQVKHTIQGPIVIYFLREGGWGTRGFYLYKNILPELSLPPPPLRQCNILSSVGDD